MAYTKQQAAATPGLQRIKDKKKKKPSPALVRIPDKPKRPGASTRPRPGGPVKPKPIKRGK